MKNIHILALLYLATYCAPTFSMHILAARSKQVAPHLSQALAHTRITQIPSQYSQALAKRSFSSQKLSPIENLAVDIGHAAAGSCIGSVAGMVIFTGSSLFIGTTASSVFGIGNDEFIDNHMEKSALAGAVAGAFTLSPRGSAVLTAITVGLAAVRYSDTIFPVKNKNRLHTKREE